MYNSFLICTFAQKYIDMKFDLITENERLWAVRYDDCLDNVLDFIHKDSFVDYLNEIK